MGSLLAGVAHELNNPLSIVVGQSGLLQELSGSPAVAARAEKIRRAADRCARIVKTFLAMARRRAPEMAPVDLNAVVTAAIDLVAYSLRTSDIAVETELAPDLPQVMGDGDQLGQVATNLLVNAQQALMEREAPRRLRVATRFDPAANAAVLSVADNGPGVPAELRARIFEPSFTTKPTGVGTGVGLSMCRGVVESHGGTIEIEETPGGGATFVIALPLRAAAATAPHDAPSRRPAAGPKRRLLVVDDEPEVAQTLADILVRAGHRVDIAGDGQQALARIAAADYDLVLSDLRMPVLDGPGLYRALAERRPDYLDRILFVTGDTLAAHVTSFLADTEAPCIEKPLDPRAVQEAVARALEGVQASASGTKM